MTEKLNCRVRNQLKVSNQSKINPFSGTGKTYTMLGTGDNPGIMALAINEIFALVRKGAENSTYTVYMSYLEVRLGNMPET